MKKIDRHNYEEYFILYMDNELSSAERRMVEDFVQLHPDLKEELELLSQYKLTPDTHIVFPGKEELLKTTDNSLIHDGNYEEWFSSYIDNELGKTEKQAVEQFIAAHPAYAKKLQLLEKTKLQPEAIVFPDKSSLYRQEEKVRVVTLRWWKVAVAAILILGIGLTTLNIVNNRKTAPDKNDIASKDNNETKSPVTVPEANQLPAPVVEENNNTANNIAVSTEKEDQPVYQAKFATGQQKSNVKDKNPLPVTAQKENAPVLAVAKEKQEQPTNNLPRPDNNPNVIAPVQEKNAVAAINNTAKENVNPPANSIAGVTKQTPASSDIKQAAFQNDNDVALNQRDGKKNKLRGFFRKITRTFEKRTDIDATDEDNKLLVAGLAINLN